MICDDLIEANDFAYNEELNNDVMDMLIKFENSINALGEVIEIQAERIGLRSNARAL